MRRNYRPRNTGTRWPDGNTASASCFSQVVLPNVMRKETSRSSTETSASALESPLVMALEEAIHILFTTGYPSISRVALGLRVPVRTLQRRLHNQGLTYSELIDFLRQREAYRKLMAKGESIVHIVAAMGYADPSSFSRAFRRWTNMPPSAYRRRSRRTRGDDVKFAARGGYGSNLT